MLTQEVGNRQQTQEEDRGVDRVASWVVPGLWVTARLLDMTRGSVTIARMSLRRSARSFRRQSFGQRSTSSVELRLSSAANILEGNQCQTFINMPYPQLDQKCKKVTSEVPEQKCKSRYEER